MMCEELFNIVTKENDVLLNLLNLRHELKRIECNKCHQISNDFVIIDACHDSICRKCLDQNYNGKCPSCNTPIDPKVHTFRTNEELFKSALQMEEFLLNVIRVQRKSFPELYTKDKFISPKEIKSNNLSQVNDVSQSSQMNGIQNKIKINNIDVMEQMNEEENITNTTSIENTQIHEDESESDTSNNSIQCDDVIQGTPERSNVDLESGLSDSKKNMFLVHVTLPADELQFIISFAFTFNIKAQTLWSDNITHLVVYPSSDGECARTKKYLNALFSGCFIVTLDWIKDCLKSNCLLSENDYLPRGPESFKAVTNALHIKRGIIESTLAWTSTFAIFFHYSIETKELYRDFVIWANKAGFMVIKNMKEFNNCDTFSTHIILADISDDEEYPLPEDNEISNWIINYKAITLYLDWFLDCLYKHEFVKIEPKYHIMKLNSSQVQLLDIPLNLLE